MPSYMIDVSEETRQILLSIAYGQVSGTVAADVGLSENELVEIAVDLLAQSYDASLPDDGGEDAVPATAADLHKAISDSLDPDISTGMEIRSAQGSLKLSGGN